MSIPVGLIILGMAGLAVAVLLAMRAGSGAIQRERDAGLAAVRELGWKDFATLVVKAFETRGFKPVAGGRKPGDDGIDQMLERGGQKHILQVKHGGAYHVGAAAVRRLLAVIDQHHAAGGILATSGEFDAAAREAAKRQPVVLLEAEALWQQIGPLLPATSLAIAQARVVQMEAGGRRRVVATTALSLLLVLGGVAMVTLGPTLGGMRPVADVPEPQPEPIPAAEPVATPEPEVAAAPSPVASVRPPPATEKELAVQRDLVAAQVILIDGVVSATWPSKSTLLVAVRGGDDARRGEIVKGICGVLTRREDLRFSRLQIYDFNLEGDAENNVRFRQCT